MASSVHIVNTLYEATYQHILDLMLWTFIMDLKKRKNSSVETDGNVRHDFIISITIG